MNIIFHHPLPLNKDAVSASGIRPLRMLSAFQSLGYKVDVVSGYSADRKRGMAQIKDNIAKGVEYDFVYSESSTMPTILTDPNHLPFHPFLDWLFFRFCNKNNIPVGLFYRDIYWLFDGYGKGLGVLKSGIAKIAYRFDLWVYEDTLTRLFLPSLEMGRYVPRVNPEVFGSLPPGHNLPKVNIARSGASERRSLKLFYVGGMSSHYRLHKLFDVVRGLPGVELTICTREAEWNSVRPEYPSMGPNISVVHKSGAAMEAFLAEADIAMLFVEPQEYWEFAAPVKLYEYVGHGKPIIASEGTLAGRFVKDNKVGWTIPYETAALAELLNYLRDNPDALQKTSQNVANVAPGHTWEARARRVIEDLAK